MCWIAYKYFDLTKVEKIKPIQRGWVWGEKVPFARNVFIIFLASCARRSDRFAEVLLAVRVTPR